MTKLTIRDYLLGNIDQERDHARRRIREIKKDIKVMDLIKKEIRTKTEKDLREILEKDKELLEEFDRLNDQLVNKEKDAIKDMVDKGIIRDSTPEELAALEEKLKKKKKK